MFNKSSYKKAYKNLSSVISNCYGNRDYVMSISSGKSESVKAAAKRVYVADELKTRAMFDACGIIY